MNKTLIKFGLFFCIFFILFFLGTKKVQAAYDYEYHQLSFVNGQVTSPNGMNCYNSNGGVNCDYYYFLGKKGIDWTYVAVYKRSVDDEGTMTFQTMWSSAQMPKNENISYYSDQMAEVPGESRSNYKHSFNIWFSNSGGGSTGFNFYFYIARPQKTLQNLVISPASMVLTSGQTQQFTATATYSDNTTKDVTTSSTWTAAANIGTINNTSSKGLFTASATSVPTGLVSASYTESGVTKTATANVTVNPIQSFTVSLLNNPPPYPANPTTGIKKGQAANYTVTVISKGGFGGDVNLSVDDIVHNVTNPDGSSTWLNARSDFEVKFNGNLDTGKVTVPGGGSVSVPMTVTPKDSVQIIIPFPYMLQGVKGSSGNITYWTKAATIYVTEGQAASGITVTGDIYSKGNINMGNISIGSKSVIAAGGIINAGGDTSWQIPNTYTYALTALMKNKMTKNVERLKLNANDLNSFYTDTLPSTFVLDPSDGNPNTSTLANTPEGQVWIYNGDLSINDTTTFYGKGTIIVKGKFTINGDIKYGDNASLGIIADNIEIGPNVKKLQGAYYSFGEIMIH